MKHLGRFILTSLFVIALLATTVGGALAATRETNSAPQSGPTQGCTGRIFGTVFNDVNGNGVRNSGEGGVAGVTVQLFRFVGGIETPIGTDITDANGNYSFANIPPGEYLLVVVPGVGYQRVEPFTASVNLPCESVRVDFLVIAQAPTPTHGAPTPAAPPAEVPEADTLVLLGSGGTGFASYLLFRWRNRRRVGR